ncbi:hypothetical protein BDR22DRAFT_869568 [Usnea florida]
MTRSASTSPLDEIERPAKHSPQSSTSSNTIQQQEDNDLHPQQAPSSQPSPAHQDGLTAPVPHASLTSLLPETPRSSTSDLPQYTPSDTSSNLYIIEREGTSRATDKEEQDVDQEYQSDSSSPRTSESAPEQTDPYMATTVLKMREVLQKNWLFIDDDDAEKLAQGLMEIAKEIINGKRGSDWGLAKRQQARQYLKKYGGEPEASFIVKLMKYFHRDTRMIPDEHLDDAALQEAHAWIEKAWEKDHLNERYNIDFLTDGLPVITSGDDYVDKLISTFPRIQNPRPDVAWGIWKDAFDETQCYILDNQKNNLAGADMYDVCFIIEAKCMNGSINEAENQCMRSGCAMVNTRRRLNKAAGVSIPSAAEYPKVDINTFAFSLALGSDHARLFVNWALEVGPGHVKWHMHRLASYDYRTLDELDELHRHMNNVLDWAVTKRKSQVIQLCGKIKEAKGLYMPPKKRQRKNDGTANERLEDT